MLNCSKIDSNIMQRLKKNALMRLNKIQINLVSYWLGYFKKQRNKGTRRSHHFIIIIIIVIIIHYTLLMVYYKNQ